jgi:chitin disaccharide deacetylase
MGGKDSMNTVLVNADDFGLHADIDRGILDCIDAGVLQSISFSVVGKSLDWNRVRDLQHRGIRTGLHVTLVGEKWLSDGRLVRDWRELVKRLTFGGKSMRDAVAAETRLQLQKSLDNGVTPSHIDSHQHVHAFNGVWQPCEQIARELNIRIRIPACAKLRVIKKNLGGIALQVLSKRRARHVQRWLPCLGLAHAGHNTADIFAHELDASRGQDIELVVHPGVNTPSLESRYADWHFNWTGERDALLTQQFRDALARNNFTFMPILSSNPAANASRLAV